MPTRLALMRDQVRYQPGSADAVFELAYEYFRLRNYNDAAIGFKRVLLNQTQCFFEENLTPPDGVLDADVTEV